MGKGHRDNRQARIKRGPAAFQKRDERRAEPKKTKCNLCGTPTRPEKLVGGNCPRCIQRLQGAAI